MSVTVCPCGLHACVRMATPGVDLATRRVVPVAPAPARCAHGAPYSRSCDPCGRRMTGQDGELV